MPAQIAFLIDVDNTLLDNDQVKQHLQATLRSAGGEALDKRFWQVYEEVRADLGAVSVPVTLERLREESTDPAAIDRLGQELFATPFALYIYPGALELLRWMRSNGLPVILSDGDPWFQAKKITDAGIGAAANGNVLIFLHKEKHIDDIRAWYPAEHYIAIDDKARLLALLKDGFWTDLTTIWVQQGHYAVVDRAGELPPPDYSVDGIGDVRAIIEPLLARRPSA
jgi:hypothetical protein